MIKNTSLCYTTLFSAFRLQKPNNWTNLSVRAHARETYKQKNRTPLWSAIFVCLLVRKLA